MDPYHFSYFHYNIILKFSCYSYSSLNFHCVVPSTFQVSTIVQVVGIILCLHAATRISHRAQGIASLASRWHAFLACSSTDSSCNRVSNNVGNLEAAIHLNSIEINFSESDLESMDYSPIPTNAQLASYMSSYHKRQAFGMEFTHLVSILHLFLFMLVFF
jgi:hypothetical protein